MYLTQADAAASLTQQPDDVYGEAWGTAEIPTAQPSGLERHMVDQDKLFVVVAVVLIIWIGLALFLFRTDRRLSQLERELDATTP